METRNVNPVIAAVEQWWSGTNFRQMEIITGFQQLEFSPKDGYQEFVDTCNNYWDKLDSDEKIELWQTY